MNEGLWLDLSGQSRTGRRDGTVDGKLQEVDGWRGSSFQALQALLKVFNFILDNMEST